MCINICHVGTMAPRSWLLRCYIRFPEALDFLGAVESILCRTPVPIVQKNAFSYRIRQLYSTTSCVCNTVLTTVTNKFSHRCHSSNLHRTVSRLFQKPRVTEPCKITDNVLWLNRKYTLSNHLVNVTVNQPINNQKQTNKQKNNENG